MRKFRLDRRAFLSGLGGTAVALPLLEVMTDGKAVAQVTSPKRYLVAFCGQSIGTTSDLFVPDNTGAGYDLKRALAPLAPVQDSVSVISNLEIPWGDSPPAGGRPPNFHASTVGPLVSGMRADSASAEANGPTSDVIVGNTLGADTKYRSLQYRVQAQSYRGGDYGKHRMSYNDVNSPNDPIFSPRLAYDGLFNDFAPADPEQVGERDALLAQDISVLDLVNASADDLMSRVSYQDQQRLQRHFDELRDLERRIGGVEPTSAQGGCQLLEQPGEDPTSELVEAVYGEEVGYSNEEARAQIFVDLVHMAFACDMTRSISLMFTYAQSFMNAETVIPAGIRSDLHELGHGAGSIEDVSDGIAWQVGHWADLIAKLRDTPDGDGSLLDSSALVFLTEGGWGYDPEAGADGVSHSSENMAVLVAGHVGGLQSGVHIRTERLHPAQCLVDAMNAVGVETDSLGEVSGGIPGLRA